MGSVLSAASLVARDLTIAEEFCHFSAAASNRLDRGHVLINSIENFSGFLRRRGLATNNQAIILELLEKLVVPF